MMNEVFNTVLSMSIVASVVIGIVIAVRALMKNKLSKRFAYSLWLIVLLRLAIPMNFESSLSLFNYLPSFSESESVGNSQLSYSNYSEAIDYAVELYEGNHQPIPNSSLISASDDLSVRESVNNDEIANDQLVIGDDVVIKNGRDISAKTIISYLWGIVLAVLLGYFIYSYVKIDLMLKDATLLKERSERVSVYISDKIESPILLGLIFPRIIVPKNSDLSKRGLDYIIAHELVHLKRYDYIIKPVALLILCIHWFNPLVWIAFILAMKDMELSCDEKVLMAFNEKEQVQYADTLLNMSMRHNQMVLGGMVAFGEKNTKVRIKSALNFKKIPRSVSALGVLLLMILVIILATNGNEHSRIVRALEETHQYEVAKEDILEVIKKDGEMMVIHKGCNDEGEYPVYVFSHLEKRGLGWFCNNSYYDTRIFSQLNETVATINNGSGVTDEQTMVSGIVKKEDVSKAKLYHDAADLTDHFVTMIPVEENVWIWYKIIDDKLSSDFNIDFINENDEVIFSVSERDELAKLIEDRKEQENSDKRDKQNNQTEKEQQGSKESSGKETSKEEGSVDKSFEIRAGVRDDIAREQGYNYGTLFSLSKNEGQILLFNFNGDNTNLKLVTVNQDYEVIKEEAVILNEAFKEYSFTGKFGDFSKQNYLVGIREKKIENDNMIADIVCIPKDDLSEVIVYDPPYISEPMQQGTIPVIIDFTLDISGDYLIYQDIDQYWKVRNIKTGEIFVSDETETRTAYIDEVENFMQEPSEIIPIVRYRKDGSMLVFDTNTKRFDVTGGQVDTNTNDYLFSPSVTQDRAENMQAILDYYHKEMSSVGPWKTVYYNDDKVVIYNGILIAYDLSDDNRGIYEVIDTYDLNVGSYQGSSVAMWFVCPDGSRMIIGVGGSDSGNLYACNFMTGEQQLIDTEQLIDDVTWYKDEKSNEWIAKIDLRKIIRNKDFSIVEEITESIIWHQSGQQMDEKMISSLKPVYSNTMYNSFEQFGDNPEIENVQGFVTEGCISVDGKDVVYSVGNLNHETIGHTILDNDVVRENLETHEIEKLFSIIE